MTSSVNLGTLPAVSSATGGSVPPSSHCETGASLPSTGIHAAADGNVTRKAHRQDLAEPSLEQVSPAADAATDGQPPAQDQVHHGKYAWDQGMRSSGQLQGIGDGKYAFTSENGSAAVIVVRYSKYYLDLVSTCVEHGRFNGDP